MAQNKYDLLLVPGKSDQTIRQQPWYKERLRTKYLKQRKKGERSECLIGHNWVLVRSGIDDFRDGKPPDFEGKFVVDGTKGISPVVKRSKDTLSSRLRRQEVKVSNPRPRLTKRQVCFDKQLPKKRDHSDHIDDVEYGLTQHPLALYPHLEEGMPPELFEEIVDLLDPAMNPETESEIEESSDYSERRDTMERIFGPQQSDSIIEETNRQESSLEESDKSFLAEIKARNPYKWILRKDSGSKDDKKGTKKRATSPSQDEHIKKVTKEFCDWVTDLGGESNNVEESTIMSLFASGYETKPALSVPIHVVELSNVPIELRISAGISPPASAKKSAPSSAVPTVASDEDVSNYEPSWVKVRYGAWYLDPDTWKAQGVNQPLEDPEEIAKREMSESKKKSVEMDAQLAPLHGSRAFRDFLERNNKRKPEFMDRVSNLQDLEDAKNEVIQQKSDQSSRQSLTRIRSGVTSRSAVSFFQD